MRLRVAQFLANLWHGPRTAIHSMNRRLQAAGGADKGRAVARAGLITGLVADRALAEVALTTTPVSANPRTTDADTPARNRLHLSHPSRTIGRAATRGTLASGSCGRDRPRGADQSELSGVLDGAAACARSTSPIEREPADAWADFVGWRIDYEHAAR